MRLLAVMVCNSFPPRTGNTIVAYNSIKHLSKYHDIDFICLQSTKAKSESIEFFNNIEFVHQKEISKFYKLIRIALYTFFGVPSSVSAFPSKAMKDKILKIVKSVKYDAILLFEMKAIQYFPNSLYDKIIVNIEDPQSIRNKRMADLTVWSKREKLNLFFKSKITEIYERKVLPKMGKVILLSEADMQDMQKQAEYKNIGTVSYGVDKSLSKDIIDYEMRTEGKIIFSGNMFHPPNVDGALFFLKNIFPIVLKKYPKAILWIVGAEPDTRISDAASVFGDHVVITGRVDDISEYLRSARVSICPVRLKIGVQTKILEAFSCGTPVVTTSAGNSGISGSSGKELFVEDDPVEFANRVVELLRGESWNKMSGAGRKLVEKQFSWEKSIEQLNRHLESMIPENG